MQERGIDDADLDYAVENGRVRRIDQEYDVWRYRLVGPFLSAESPDEKYLKIAFEIHETDGIPVIIATAFTAGHKR